MSSSLKHRNFVSEPIGDKLVTELPGIGPVAGKKLEKAGYDKAYAVLGKLLGLKKDKDAFQAWLKETCNCNKRDAENCYNGLIDWCKSFM